MTQPPPEQPYGNQSGYGQSPYGPPPGYGVPPQGYGGSRPKGMAITALVLGALAVLTCWTIIGGFLLGIVAIILGMVAASRAKKGTAGGRGLAITGAVLGLLGVVLAGVLLAVVGSFFNSESAKNLRDCLEQAGDSQAQIDDCEQEFRDELTN